MTRKILLVEDTPDVVENLTELLQMEGYEVFAALDAVTALEILRNLRPDLIMTDLRMPKMDGFAFIEKVKSNDQLDKIPIVVFTANGTPENEQRSLDLGAVAFLKKPCNTDLLLDAIQSILHA